MTHSIETRLNKLEAQFRRALAVRGFIHQQPMHISEEMEGEIGWYIKTGEMAAWMSLNSAITKRDAISKANVTAETITDIPLALELGNKLNEFENKYNELVNALYHGNAATPADHDEVLRRIQRLITSGSVETLTYGRNNELEKELEGVKADLKKLTEKLSLEREGRKRLEVQLKAEHEEHMATWKLGSDEVVHLKEQLKEEKNLNEQLLKEKLEEKKDLEEHLAAKHARNLSLGNLVNEGVDEVNKLKEQAQKNKNELEKLTEEGRQWQAVLTTIFPFDLASNPPVRTLAAKHARIQYLLQIETAYNRIRDCFVSPQ